MNHISELKKHKSQQDQKAFNAVLDRFLPGLQRYIRHRIKTAEAKHLLPVNFYDATDVLAEVYLRIYDKMNEIEDEKGLKIQMFRLADEIIEEYIRKEKPGHKRLPVDKLLAEELKMMREVENLTVDADGEIVLVDELDDISYHQDEFKPKVFLFDKDAEKDFARALNLSEADFNEERFRNVFGSIYAQLPDTVRRILDLVSIGGLTAEEAAGVLNISVGEVNEALEGIKMQIDKNR